jgi:O-antigen/teichoic acid export membrane protein
LFTIRTIKNWIISPIKTIAGNKKIAYHTGILFASTIAVSLLGVLTKSFQARALHPDDYGLYAFFITLTSFSVVFFHAGIFPTLEYMLASNQDPKRERELFGAGILITFFIGIVFSLFLFVASYWVDALFDIEFNAILRMVAPLCFILPLRLLISFLAIGSNKITYTALFDVLVQGLFLLVLGYFFFYSDLSLLKIMVISLVTSIIAFVLICFLFQPSFNHLRATLIEIKKVNKEYGIQAYGAMILNEVAYRADEFLIAFFLNTTLLGYYSLANMICSPMVMLGVSAASALFKKFSSDTIIHPKLIQFNHVWIIVSATVLYLFGDFAIALIFGKNFMAIRDYIMPLSIAYLFKTLQQPYAFLTAKGMGKEIKNISFAEGGVSIIANLIFIPLWGIYGVIFAAILSRATGFFARKYYYKRYLSTHRRG